LAEDSLFNRDFIEYYYDYKRRNSYSEMEISQKREALENVLVPYKLVKIFPCCVTMVLLIAKYFSSGTTLPVLSQ
jgi:hypothetical protein